MPQCAGGSKVDNLRLAEWLPQLISQIVDWARLIDKQTLNTALLFIIVLWLSLERRKFEKIFDAVVTLRQLVSALRQEQETPPEPDPQAPRYAAAGQQNWQKVRDLWADARNRIELKIDDLDGRIRRGYANMPRYSYAEIIDRLYNRDRQFSQNAAKALLEMNNAFFALRPKPYQTTSAEAEEFESLYRIAEKELPKDA
jgi:hypothetical protein